VLARPWPQGRRGLGRASCPGRHRIRPVTADGDLVSLRLLWREELGAQRTHAVCRLHRLLAEPSPGGMRRELSAGKAQALLAQIQPGDEVSRIRVQIARDHLADIRALDARLKYIGFCLAFGRGLARWSRRVRRGVLARW